MVFKIVAITAIIGLVLWDIGSVKIIRDLQDEVYAIHKALDILIEEGRKETK